MGGGEVLWGGLWGGPEGLHGGEGGRVRCMGGGPMGELWGGGSSSSRGGEGGGGMGYNSGRGYAGSCGGAQL